MLLLVIVVVVIIIIDEDNDEEDDDLWVSLSPLSVQSSLFSMLLCNSPNPVTELVLTLTGSCEGGNGRANFFVSCTVNGGNNSSDASTAASLLLGFLLLSWDEDDDDDDDGETDDTEGKEEGEDPRPPR